MDTTKTFLSGAVVGLAIASLVYYLFSFVVTSVYSDAVISGVTLIGIGCALGGYTVRWMGDRSATTVLVLGLGVGIVIVAFVGIGNGVSPAFG